jgi:redox-regulated HSP33 family molecular chaperone
MEKGVKIDFKLRCSCSKEDYANILVRLTHVEIQPTYISMFTKINKMLFKHVLFA